MTQLDSATIVMGLQLKHPDSIVQLLDHYGELILRFVLSIIIPTIVVLVGEHCEVLDVTQSRQSCKLTVVDPDSVRVMRTDKGDISVTSAAELETQG